MRDIKLHVNLTQRALNEDMRFYVEFTEPCYVNGNFVHWHNDFQTPPRVLGNTEKCRNDKYWFFQNHFRDTIHGCEATQNTYRLCIDIWQYKKNPNFDPSKWTPEDALHPNPWHPNMEWFMEHQGHHKFENPIWGRPDMTYNGENGDTFVFSEGEVWHGRLPNGNGITVRRADDSDDYKEFWIDLG